MDHQPDTSSDWVSDLQQRVIEEETRQALNDAVHISRDHYHNQRLIGRLEELTYTFNYITTDEAELDHIQQLIRDRLVREYMEQNQMAPYSTTAPTHTNTFTIAESPPPAEPVAPIFQMQENVHERELRELAEMYPREIFRRDYQQSYVRALADRRTEIYNTIQHVRRVDAAVAALENCAPKYRAILLETFTSAMSNRDMRYVRNPVDYIRERQHFYTYMQDVIDSYKYERDDFINNQQTHGTQQAEYQQRAALIRQRPRKPVTIDCQLLAETLSQWDNVWGVSFRHDTVNDYLKIRLGLCDIVMSESAIESTYDYPAEIKLAPFYITIRLGNDGRFLCSSQERNVRGLSRSDNPGSTSYDIHPHQLSDTPCFGAFSQTFNDMASEGDMISLISGLIAFYSQYNSNDSAGVSARYFHPRHMPLYQDRERFRHRLYSNLCELDGPSTFMFVDDSKLDTAMTRYEEYHAHARAHEAPPERAANQIVCTSCEDADCSDDTEYYVTHDGARVCASCWSDHYCSECERYCEDCTCDPDEEY